MNPNEPKLAEAETILVVEGEIMVRMIISEYLRECGYKVIEAANADEAIVVLQRPELTVNLVLSDTEISGSMDGFALAHWIRENKSGLTVILVGSPARAAAVAGELCESGPMLSKPYDPQILLNHIKRLLARPSLAQEGAPAYNTAYGSADDKSAAADTATIVACNNARQAGRVISQSSPTARQSKRTAPLSWPWIIPAITRVPKP